MKKIRLSFFLIAACMFSISGVAQMTTFRFTYDVGLFDISGGMVQNPAGEFVFAGINNSFGPYYGDAVKIDANGTVVWAKSYNGGFATNISDIKNVSTGGYIMTGQSTSSGGGAILIRIDNSGNVMWASKYQLPDKPAANASSEYGQAVIETSDGGFLVGGGVDYFWDGVSASTVDTTSAMGFKVNSTGTLLWSKVWTIATANPDEHYINDVAESADGYFFVGQSSEGTGTLSSNGDYPSNALLIKTTTAGALTYIRRWGAGNTSSQGINSALLLTLGANAGKILLGGFDDVHAFLITVEGVGATPTMGAFNRRINGATFPPRILLVQDIMENSDGNYSVIGTQIEALSFNFYTAIFKINSSTGALIFGRGYLPIGLSAILPEGGLCSDQGYYMVMTDQQMAGFNANVIRTNTVGQTNDPASGCPGTNLNPGTQGYTVTLSTPTSSNFNLAAAVAFTPTVSNLTPVRTQHCYNAAAVLSATSTSTNISCNGGCNGTASVTASGGTAPYTYSWLPSGGTGATASGLCANNYTCTITDNVGATTTQSFAITAPSAVTATQSQTNLSCNAVCNGAASVVASGGTPGYTYSWTPSGGNTANATGLCANNYTCTITDANSCPITRIFNITQPPPITASASATQTGCTSNTGTATTTASGGTGTLTYSWAPSGGTSATANNLAAGTYTCTVTDANGCTNTAITTVTTVNGPAATLQSQSNVSCNGGSNGSATVNATGGTPGYTYSWSPSGGTGATGTGLSNGNYTCTITDNAGCTTTQSVAITQPPVITASAASTSAGCTINNGTATTTASGGTGILTYSWLPSGGSNATATGLAAGNYTCTITDANGCSTTASTTVGTSASPTASASSTDAGCTVNNGTATTTASGGTGPYTYNWSPSGGTNATATGLAAGIYTCTITDANGCTTTASAAVATSASPSATLQSQTDALCNGGNTGTATVTASGGTPGYTYAWSPSGGTSATGTGMIAGNYTCTITDAGGCTTTQSVAITEPAAIAASITSTPTGCNTSTGTATALASGGTGTLTYSWAPSGGTSATEINLAAGIYTVTITDANGCFTSAIANVSSTGGPLTSVQSSGDVLCNGGSTGSGTISATGSGPFAYAWSPSGGNAASATGLPAGSYSVSVTDANNCVTIQTLTITEPTPLASNPASTPATCGNSNGTADAVASGGTGPYTYAWNNSQTSATLSNLAGGSYSVTVTDANGCTITSTVVVGNTNAPVVTLQSSSNITCFGGTTGTATVNASGGSSPYTYAWSPSGGSAATASGLSAGTYTVTVTGSNGCVQTQTLTLTQPPAIVLTTNSIPENCGNASGSVIAITSGGTPGYTYAWSNSATNDTISNLIAGSYTVTVTDANGCTSTSTVAVINTGSASANAGASVTIIAGQSTQLNGTGGLTYSWSPSSTLSCATCANPVANPTVTTVYMLTIIDSNGCAGTDTVTVYVDISCGEVYLPNAFSPNGDNQNDVLFVRGNCIKLLDVQIYNRWGEKVFEITDPASGWDGTWRSVACEPAVFTYIMNATLLDGTEISRKGNITLVK